MVNGIIEGNTIFQLHFYKFWSLQLEIIVGETFQMTDLSNLLYDKF